LQVLVHVCVLPAAGAGDPRLHDFQGRAVCAVGPTVLLRHRPATVRFQPLVRHLPAAFSDALRRVDTASYSFSVNSVLSQGAQLGGAALVSTVRLGGGHALLALWQAGVQRPGAHCEAGWGAAAAVVRPADDADEPGADARGAP
jgi:hypothetical protein